MAPAHHLCEAFFVALTALCFRHAQAGGPAALRALAVALAYGSAVEFTVYVGMEFVQPRMYDHAPDFLLQLPGGVPVYICLLWTVFLYVSHQFVAGHVVVLAPPRWRAVILPIVAAGMAMSMDTTMEPIATKHDMWIYRIGQNLGRWNLGGDVWNGSPLINLASWFHLQAGYSIVQVVLPAKSHADGVKQVVCGVVLCLAMLSTLGPMRLVMSDGSVVKVFFLTSALTAMYTCRLHPTAPRDTDILAVVALWHAGPLLSLAFLSPAKQFSRDAILELGLLAVASVALFGMSAATQKHAGSAATPRGVRGEAGRSPSPGPKPRRR